MITCDNQNIVMTWHNSDETLYTELLLKTCISLVVLFLRMALYLY